MNQNKAKLINKTLIIAEAGVNHNGSITIAKEMIDVAAEAKADYVKFQTFVADNVVTQSATKAEYQLSNTGKNESQYDMLKKLELNLQEHEELIAYCNTKKIKFLSAPFDLQSIDLLDKLNMSIFKIPSGEITNLPYLRHIASLNKPVILSTGMSSLTEIENTLKIFEDNGLSKSKVTVLHCNTQYPTPFEDVNILAMLTIKEKLNVNVGYSDHTLGIEVPILAVALGATVIEKHFTLDKNMKGPDHRASLEPEELKKMVKAIRNIEKSFGSGIKEPSNSEKINISIARKSIVAKKFINKGDIFNTNNLTVKRPGNGTSPMEWDNIIGKRAMKNYKPEDLI
jgi:N,N'-diacetyllegionaminate synthase